MNSNKKIQVGTLVLGLILIGYGLLNNKNNSEVATSPPEEEFQDTAKAKEGTHTPRKTTPTITSKKRESVADKYRKMCEHTETSFNCVTFVRNYDADTITVNIPNVHPLIGKEVSVRVRGVDAPEMRGDLPCEKNVAVKAKAFVFQKLKNGKIISLKNVAKDKYFRVLADVHVDGENLSESLVKKGYAYPYFGGKKERLNWCLKF